jgi:hypothetical protein
MQCQALPQHRQSLWTLITKPGATWFARKNSLSNDGYVTSFVGDSLARDALYKDGPVLILDEAISALDTKQNIAGHCAQASTIQHADRIIMMNSGRIVESVTHTL